MGGAAVGGAGGKGDDFEELENCAAGFEGLREARGGSIKSYFPGLPAAGLDAGLLGAMGGAVVGGATGGFEGGETGGFEGGAFFDAAVFAVMFRTAGVSSRNESTSKSSLALATALADALVGLAAFLVETSAMSSLTFFAANFFSRSLDLFLISAILAENLSVPALLVSSSLSCWGWHTNRRTGFFREKYIGFIKIFDNCIVQSIPIFGFFNGGNFCLIF